MIMGIRRGNEELQGRRSARVCMNLLSCDLFGRWDSFDQSSCHDFGVNFLIFALAFFLSNFSTV